MAVPWATVLDPPLSFIEIVVEYEPLLAYVWAAGDDEPAGPVVTVPAELGVPSPQLIVAVKSDGTASELRSVNVAAGPPKGVPATRSLRSPSRSGAHR